MKNGIQQVKNSKYFVRYDIIAYVAVAVIAVVLLLVFLLPQKGELKGFVLTIDNEEVMTYDFEKDEFSVAEKYRQNITVEGNGEIATVTVNCGHGFNVFTVDKKNKKIKMKEADCSISQDCTYMPAIEKEGDSIICVPHKLKIVALGAEKIDEPVTG